MPKRILVDMDGVIADWGAGWDAALDRLGTVAAEIPRHIDQRSFDLNEGRTDVEKRIIEAVFNQPGFYRDLMPIDGARTALKALLKAGHDVRIVTSPWISNPTCASDKLNWIARYYGSHWAARTVVTADKSLVRGDILIDDKPNPRNEAEAEWEHVLFDQPYNRNVEGKRRLMDWFVPAVFDLVDGVIR